jgi:hypothetical protein
MQARLSRTGFAKPSQRDYSNAAMSQERRGQNEAIFRRANERLKERLSQLEADGRIPFVCECSNADCLQTVELTSEAYERVRAGHNHYFMLTGHEDAATEKVVERHERYIVTEKYQSQAP